MRKSATPIVLFEAELNTLRSWLPPERASGGWSSGQDIVLADHPDPELQIHVVLDNRGTHKAKHDRWLARNRNVHVSSPRASPP